VLHGFSGQNAADVQKAGGVRMLKDKEWISKTPEQRDAYLRDLRKTIPVNVRIVLTVPNGEIWLIEGIDYVLLSMDNIVSPWTEAEKEALPKTVSRGGSISHSDIHGAGQIQVQVDVKF
jgi:hypothetical protein